MRRTPIVLASTVAGLTGVAVFHSTPQKIVLSSFASTPAQSATASAPTTGAPTTGPAGSAAGSAAASAPTTTAPGTPSPSATAAPRTSSTTATASSSVTRSATGPVTNYYYGQLSVKVTATGTKIDAITIATLSDGGNPYSAYVDHIALPMLQRQAMAAQSANIQGVSGASYTSAGFDQSLQGALSALKLK